MKFISFLYKPQGSMSHNSYMQFIVSNYEGVCNTKFWLVNQAVISCQRKPARMVATQISQI